MPDWASQALVQTVATRVITVVRQGRIYDELLPDAVHVAMVLSPFAALPAVGWLASRRGGLAHLPALIPAALTGYFAYAFWLVGLRGPFTVTSAWAPALDLSLSFRFDGLSALFATLIAGAGTLIAIYARKYLEAHPHAGRFHVALFAFMGSMLGVVLSDNLIAAVRLLGADRLHVVSAHRVRARATGGAAGGDAGPARHRRRRSRTARGCPAAG